MTTVMVSGCYDILHAGHVQFFEDAREFGDELVVCVAGDDVIRQHKRRRPALPATHRLRLVDSLEMVDRAYLTSQGAPGLDFVPWLMVEEPDYLVTTQDDRYEAEKRALCELHGVRYEQVLKTRVADPVSSTRIRQRISVPERVPLRVDFAGGWLDVPERAIEGAYIVNCAVDPCVGDGVWPYKMQSGLGGSAAYAILAGDDGVISELSAGVGWQDPAVITETGLCVWASGPRPRLVWKSAGAWLRGRMAVVYVADRDPAADIAPLTRDYAAIAGAGSVAMHAARNADYGALCEAVRLSYRAQLDEGMAELPEAVGCRARKWCGAGHGGYALYLMSDGGARNDLLAHMPDSMPVEPYDRWGT